MADDAHHRVAPSDKQPGVNPFVIATLVAIPAAILVGVKVGGQGTLAGSGFALGFVAGAIAYGILYAVILVVREAWHRRTVSLSLPWGTKVDPQKPDTADPRLAQHEAITKQAGAMEGFASSMKDQLQTTTEQLQSQTERADALAKENKELVEENARLRGGPPAGSGGQEIRASRANPHD